MKMKNYLMLILICMSFVATAQSSGYASFIGDKFHGLKMANGETYNKNSLVAGHRDLEYGTKVKVTNTKTSKSVIVTIKDRGPFIKGGIIELSRKAGETIGMTYDKKAPVRIEVVGAGGTVVEVEEKPAARSTKPTSKNTAKGKEVSTYNAPKKKAAPKKSVAKPAKPRPVAKSKSASKPKPATSSIGSSKPTSKRTGMYKVDFKNVTKQGYGVQIGVFSDLKSTVYKVKTLSAKGFKDIYVYESGGNYKIILSNYSTMEKATAYKKALKSKYKISGFIVAFSNM